VLDDGDVESSAEEDATTEHGNELGHSSSSGGITGLQLPPRSLGAPLQTLQFAVATISCIANTQPIYPIQGIRLRI
jgi:hypothetical protein